MAQKLKFGNGTWATKEGSTLSYNDENSNFKPIPFTTTRDSIATRVNKEGLIEVVSNDVPRIDYTDSADGALLLEPARTNLVTYSEDFSNWNTIQSSLTSDYGISPDGSTNSTRCVFSSSNQSLELTVSASNVIATIYIKGTIGETIQFGTNGAEEIFTLSGDWQRLEKYNSSSVSRVTLNTYAGVTARDVEIWGAQLEQGSYATSYIPTSGSAVTRLADVCNNGGNEQVINSTEGVLYFEGSALADGSVDKRIYIDDGTMNNYVAIGYSRFAGNIISEIISGGVLQTVNWGATGVNQTNNNKFALSWGSGTMKFYVNGTQTNTESVTSPTGLNVLEFNTSINTLFMEANVKDVRVYNTTLTDAELQALTQV